MKTTMRDLIDHSRQMEKELFGGEEEMPDRDIVDRIECIGKYINESTDRAKSIVLERVSEEDFVLATTSLVTVLAQSMFMKGKSEPMQLLLSGDGKEYTDTIVMTVIGMLLDEEIL